MNRVQLEAKVILHPYRDLLIRPKTELCRLYGGCASRSSGLILHIFLDVLIGFAVIRAVAGNLILCVDGFDEQFRSTDIFNGN
jgi:hypothetical protein